MYCVAVDAHSVLELDENHLSGSIPPSLSTLTLLTRLELDVNLLTGSVPQLPNSLKYVLVKAGHWAAA